MGPQPPLPIPHSSLPVVNICPVTIDNNKTGGLRRIGALGDIHCEDDRLETALRFFETVGLDLVCSVGDVVDGPGDPNRTIDLLIEHNVACIQGNHERWLLKGEMRDLPDSNTYFDFKMSSWEFVKGLPAWRKFDTVLEELLHTVGVVSSSMGQIWWPLKDFG